MAKAQQKKSQIEAYGDVNTFKLIYKTISREHGWMKSCSAMEIANIGCLVAIESHQMDKNGNSTIATALEFVPGICIDHENRKLISIKDAKKRR